MKNKTIKVKNLLPITFSIVVAILHKSLCEQYTKLTRLEWVPTRNDIFYGIAIRLKKLYKRYGEKKNLVYADPYVDYHPKSEEYFSREYEF